MPVTRRAALLAAPVFAVTTMRAFSTEPIRIGVVASLTGPAAESGRFQVNGARLALEAINSAGGVLGRPLELVIEDDQTTNPGAVLAFSHLSGQSDIVAFLGPVRSTLVHAIAPDVARTSRPMIIGGSDPTLTHMGNRWLFRCRPNDSFSTRVMADFGVTTLGKKKWAIVHSTDAFGTSAMKALTAALDGLGLKPSLVQGYANQQADFTPLVLAVKQADADILGGYFTFENDVTVFARQFRQLDVQLPWIGSANITTTTALQLGGPALFGTYAVADFHADANPQAKDFAARYEAQYKSRADMFSAWSYDAATILGRAMASANSTEPEAIRTVIIAIKGHKGAEGEYNFDENGDGLHGYNIVRNENGRVVFEKHIDFPS